MFYDYETITHGKWILAGEHAVLRGSPALVYPCLDKKLILSYLAHNKPLSIETSGTYGAAMLPLFKRVLTDGLKRVCPSMHILRGHFVLHSEVPLGVGLGGSAAICVAAARWFAAQQHIPEDHVFDFARQLEHLFHGQSSGLDIAGASSLDGVYFQQGQMHVIPQTWQPHIKISSSGQRGLTADCIERVRLLWQQDPVYAASIDQNMQVSVTKAYQALAHKTPTSFQQLAEAIHTASDCFTQWGLVHPTLAQHMQALRDAGAVAVKPTGSGGGGCVISLWADADECH